LLSAPVKNLGTADRLLRVILAEVCILVAFFWAPMEWQIPLYLVAGVMLLQAATSTCGLYNLLGWNSCEIVKRNDKKMVAVFVVVALAIALVGGYASAVLSKNSFIESLEQVKEPYSLILQYSGQGQRNASVEQFGKLEDAWVVFHQKYSGYRPLSVRFDGNFSNDLNVMSLAISGSKEDINSGNLTRGHDKLQKAWPALQKIYSG
jgi:hypothetical protein